MFGNAFGIAGTVGLGISNGSFKAKSMPTYHQNTDSLNPVTNGNSLLASEK
jgi:hypothetical protein